MSANEKWGNDKSYEGVPAKACDMQHFAITLGSIQLDGQDVDIVVSSVITLVKTLLKKWDPPISQRNKSTCVVVSIRLLYNCNIDVPEPRALQELMNNVSRHVEMSISCKAIDASHIYRKSNSNTSQPYVLHPHRNPLRDTLAHNRITLVQSLLQKWDEQIS